MQTVCDIFFSWPPHFTCNHENGTQIKWWWKESESHHMTKGLWTAWISIDNPLCLCSLFVKTSIISSSVFYNFIDVYTWISSLLCQQHLKQTILPGQASPSPSPSPPRPGQSPGFQAKPGLHITRSENHWHPMPALLMSGEQLGLGSVLMCHCISLFFHWWLLHPGANVSKPCFLYYIFSS